MRREWSPEDLIESWTLLGQGWTLVGSKSGPTRLGFALPRAYPRCAIGRSTSTVRIGWRDPDEDLPGDFDTTYGRFRLDMNTRVDLTAAPVRVAIT